jgi:LacI family transcriptional regulator
MVHATIRDVAREADVSVASVSRVLNGHSNVRPAVRERVQAAATALGYVPHAGARNLSLARTNAIGVMLPDLHGEFFSETARGIDSEASARGLQLLLSNAHANPARAVETLRTMRGRVDGVIIMAPDLDPQEMFGHLPASLPAVLINCRENTEGRAELRVDNAAGAEAMVEHLVAIGRRRIVHLSGPEGNSEAQARVAGYRAAMVRHGLAPRVLGGDFLEESGVAAAEELLPELDGSGAADALFAANDMMAIGALMRFRRAGVDVPGRIAIAGFDDVPLARLISPALTTMRVGIAGIGARAVVRLAALIAGGVDHAVEPRTPELIVRETTGATTDTKQPACREQGQQS